MMREAVKKQIKSIDRLSIECKRCGTEIIMKVDIESTAKTPYSCCGCGLDFEIDRMDDLYGRLQALLRASKRSELKARFYIVCEEEE